MALLAAKASLTTMHVIDSVDLFTNFQVDLLLYSRFQSGTMLQQTLRAAAPRLLLLLMRPLSKFIN